MDHGLNIDALAVVAGCVVVWSLVSARLGSLDITAPIAFVVAGLVTANGPTQILHLSLHSSAIRSIAEITLALVLFADASRVNMRVLAADVGLPVRLLALGLPLTIGAGTALAAGLFSSSGIWVAAVIGTVVAPTDAALGASIISDERVPVRVRRVLNVESGLNDGIAAPFVNLFLAGALASESINAGGAGRAAVDLLGGAGLGAAVGVSGALLLLLADRLEWSEPGFRPLGVTALALFAYATSLIAGTNGFVAAFVAGIAFGSVHHRPAEVISFTEDSGTLMSLLVWFLFGAVMLVPGVEAADWHDLVFAVGALTLARMLPVAVALAGTRLDRATVAYIGWFGPRGLASVVFGLIAVDSLSASAAHAVLGAVVVTIALSVAAHGVTASPLTNLFVARVHRLRPDCPEHHRARDLPTRALHAGRRSLAAAVDTTGRRPEPTR